MSYLNKNWIIVIIIICTQFIIGYNQKSWAKENKTSRIDERDYFEGLIPKYSEISANICCEDEKIFRNSKQQPEEFVVNYVIRMRRGDKIKVHNWPKKSMVEYECNDTMKKQCWKRVVMYEINTDLKGIALTYYCDGLNMKANISDPYGAYVPIGVISGQPRVDGAEPDRSIWCMKNSNIANNEKTKNKGKTSKPGQQATDSKSLSLDNEKFAEVK